MSLGISEHQASNRQCSRYLSAFRQCRYIYLHYLQTRRAFLGVSDQTQTRTEQPPPMLKAHLGGDDDDSWTLGASQPASQPRCLPACLPGPGFFSWIIRPPNSTTMLHPVLRGSITALAGHNRETPTPRVVDVGVGALGASSASAGDDNEAQENPSNRHSCVRTRPGKGVSSSGTDDQALFALYPFDVSVV